MAQIERTSQAADESSYSSYQHIEAKCAINLPPVYFSFNSNLAQDLLDEFKALQVSNATFRSTTEEVKFDDFPQLREEEARDREAKMREQEKMAAEFEREMQRMTEMYRKQAEKESERIMKEVEKQRQKDIDLRKQLVEAAIEHQKKQVDVESKYAKRDLDRQRNLASDSLERSRFEQQVDVNLETAAGSTHSGGTTIAVSEKEHRINGA